MKRKKNLVQSKKGMSSKAIKPDIWQRKGFVPNWKLISVMHKEDYERRSKMSEAGRSKGSNIRLKELASKW